MGVLLTTDDCVNKLNVLIIFEITNIILTSLTADQTIVISLYLVFQFFASLAWQVEIIVYSFV